MSEDPGGRMSDTLFRTYWCDSFGRFSHRLGQAEQNKLKEKGYPECAGFTYFLKDPCGTRLVHVLVLHELLYSAPRFVSGQECWHRGLHLREIIVHGGEGLVRALMGFVLENGPSKVQNMIYELKLRLEIRSKFHLAHKVC
jgi:hypothetical protein